MMNDDYQNISLEHAQQLIAKDATVVDIRDRNSYNLGHIEGAIHLSDNNLNDFILQGDYSKPLIVCCYHGHSSQPAAQFLSSKGFENVYSLIGGYTAWAMNEENN